MSDNKKYYYLKIKENFFDSEENIVLESMQDGYLYSNILLKLYLRSLKNEGKLMFNDRIPYTANILASVVRHNVGVVEKAIDIFKDFGLIDIKENGAIYMLDIQNYIGESSTEADRKRDYRNRIINMGQMSDQMSDQMSSKCPDKNPPELKIEIELKKEIDIKKDGAKKRSDASEKTIFGEYKHVKLTKSEVEKLKTEFENVEELIKELDEYIEMKGYKAKSHYLAIRKWVVEAVKEKEIKKSKNVNKLEKKENILW